MRLVDKRILLVVGRRSFFLPGATRSAHGLSSYEHSEFHCTLHLNSLLFGFSVRKDRSPLSLWGPPKRQAVSRSRSGPHDRVPAWDRCGHGGYSRCEMANSPKTCPFVLLAFDFHPQHKGEHCPPALWHCLELTAPLQRLLRTLISLHRSSRSPVSLVGLDSRCFQRSAHRTTVLIARTSPCSVCVHDSTVCARCVTILASGRWH